VDEPEALGRLAGSPVARLATVGPDGHPHVVPCVFAMAGRTIYWAVDQKPKRSNELKRLANIRANPNVELVADHYEGDWSRLWWVRATGTARIVEGQDERARALQLLAQKYGQYREQPPEGAVVAIDVSRVSSWEGTGRSA